MEFIKSINVNAIRSDLIDYAMEALYKKTTYDKVALCDAIVQRWKDQNKDRNNLSSDQYTRLRKIGYQAIGIAWSKVQPKSQMNLNF